MDTPGAHLLVVMLRTDDTRQVSTVLIDRFAAQGFDVDRWDQLSSFYGKAVDLYAQQFGVLRLIILLMVLLSVTNSVNMTLFERTREFGTLLALGDKPGAVFRLIMLESVVLESSARFWAAYCGLLGGFGYFRHRDSHAAPPNANIGYTAFIRLVPTEIALSGLIGLVATCLAALLPARRASPVESG